jgi:hypothetical protein
MNETLMTMSGTKTRNTMVNFHGHAEDDARDAATEHFDEVAELVTDAYLHCLNIA